MAGREQRAFPAVAAHGEKTAWWLFSAGKRNARPKLLPISRSTRRKPPPNLSARRDTDGPKPLSLLKIPSEAN
jgi:hypothetical protein